MIGTLGIVHPMRRMSEDEMQGRSLCNIQDPDAKLPGYCSGCSRPSTPNNPLRLVPVDRRPKALARAYLYRAICRVCSES